MEESSVVLLNMCLYIALFGFCLWRYHLRNLSTFLSLLYAITSIASYLLYNFPLYSTSYTSMGKSSLEASLYLFLLNTILITTFSNARLDKIQKLSLYNEQQILKWQKILVVFLAIYALWNFPSSVITFFSGHDLSELRNEQYADNTGNSSFFVINLISRIFGSMSIVLLCLPCINYFLCQKITRWDKLSIGVYAIMKLNTILAAVSRATIVFSLLEAFVVILLFYPFFDRRLMKLIKKWGLISLIGMYLIFSAITFARFEKQSDAAVATFATLRYAGEAQLNFMNLVYPDLKEPWCGFRQFPLFRRIMGLPYDDGTTREGESIYNNAITQNYHWRHPVHVFYSVAGIMVLNLGFILPFIVALWIHVAFKKKYKKEANISTLLIILTIIISSYYAKGIFFSDYQNESGNMMILFLIYAFFCLKIKGYTVSIDNRKITSFRFMINNSKRELSS